ncbi:MAG: hypothetical protein ABIR30_05315 [Chitinophagaceae bacterium]
MQLFVIISFIMLLLLVLLYRHFVLRKINIPAGLFAEALRNENSGYFEEAAAVYETALEEVNKCRFAGGKLRHTIIGKLKILHTVIEYKNNSTYFTKQSGLLKASDAVYNL